MLTPQTFIFIGRSGCGKGTQAEYLRKSLPEPSLYLSTGNMFREFIAAEGYANNLSRIIMDKGFRQPDFLAVWLWASVFVNKIKGGENWVIDGFPRSESEARILDTAMRFYGRDRPNILYINVSRQWAIDRLRGRGRADDKSEEIEKRLDWFEEDVALAIDYYRKNPDYNFIEINGEQTIENVWKEITLKLKFQS